MATTYPAAALRPHYPIWSLNINHPAAITPALNISHQTSSSSPSNRSTTLCVRRLILCLLLSLALVTSAGAIAWLVLHPHVPAFRVDSLSVSNLSLSQSGATADYRVQFTVTNPNRKIDVSVGHFDIYVLYEREKIAEATNLTSWLVEEMGRRELSLELGTESSRGCRVGGKTVAEMGGEQSKRVVTFGVKMVVSAKLDAHGWLSKQISMVVFCGDLKVGFFSSNATGKLITAGKDCDVHLCTECIKGGRN